MSWLKVAGPIMKPSLQLLSPDAGDCFLPFRSRDSQGPSLLPALGTTLYLLISLNLAHTFVNGALITGSSAVPVRGPCISS